jgi:hypothetical protein
MYSDYWVKWVVVEDRIEEELNRAQHLSLVRKACHECETKTQSGWWRAVTLSVSAVGRGWVAESATMARSRDIVPQLPAKEGYGAC